MRRIATRISPLLALFVLLFVPKVSDAGPKLNPSSRQTYQQALSQGGIDLGRSSSQYAGYDPRYGNNYNSGAFLANYELPQSYHTQSQRGRQQTGISPKANQLIGTGAAFVDIFKMFTSNEGSFGDRLWSLVKNRFGNRFFGSTRSNNRVSRVTELTELERYARLSEQSRARQAIDPFWLGWCEECTKPFGQNSNSLDAIFKRSRTTTR